MIAGTLVGLRAVDKRDLKQLMDWRNDPEFRKYFREYRELGLENQELWFDSRVINDPSTIMFSIIDINTKELIGCCGLCYINWVQRSADLSLYIGWNDSYIDEMGYAKESCCLLFNYAFKELGLHRVWTEIYDLDELKYKLYNSLGFQQDGLLRESYRHDGVWHDSRIMSLLEHDWNE